MDDQNKKNKKYILMMTEYRSMIKYITQIAVASLILPIIFFKDIIGVKDDIPIVNGLNCQIIFSWISLFISIGCGIWYQDIATRKIIKGNRFGLKRYPELFYGLTVWGFYLGIGFFLWGALKIYWEF